MSTQAWEGLVRRLEARAAAEPRGYKLRVAALAALGYAYVGGILVAVLGAAAGTTWLVVTGHPAAAKFALILLPLAVLILRALPVKIDPPEGIELRRVDAPELFSMIDELRAATAAPRIHHVLVDGDLNAGVAQVPRFGWFGRRQNYLVLGFPLLATFSPDEFRSVLAHELGHVSGQHGHFSAWIYRIRQTWVRLLDTLEEQGHWGAGLFRRFFRWYAPYFAAYSFVLARQQEYEADRAAARAAGSETAGRALARLMLMGPFLDESYWPSIYAQARATATSGARPQATIADGLSSLTPEQVTRFTQAALAAETGSADTHPSLSDRLRAIGVDPRAALEAATAPAASAAAALLGNALGPVVERLDEAWRQGVSEWWAREFAETEHARARLAELEDRQTLGDRDSADLLEHATLVDRTRGSEEAQPLYRAVLARSPRNAVANFAVGRALLAEGDEAGLGHLNVALTEDPAVILPACELATGFLYEQGRPEAAEGYRGRASARIEALQRAHEERRAVRLDGNVRPHELEGEVVPSLARQLSEFRQVRRAYLARRVHTHLDDEFPSYVLGVDLQVPRWKPYLGDPRPGLIRRLATEIETPIDVVFVDLKQAPALRKQLRKLPGVQIYARK